LPGGWKCYEARSKITRSVPELTRDMALTSSQKYSYSNEKVRNVLGYDFIPVEKSVSEICQKFLEDIFVGT